MINTIAEFCTALRSTGMFDELEVRIINSMLNLQKDKQDKVTAILISKEAGITVTNTYKYLYSLQQKGMIESAEGKNKIFWLARSSNPFPRLMSYATRDFLKKKDFYKELGNMYSVLVPKDEVWAGEKIYEQYTGGFIDKAALLFDVSKKEILITTKRFYDDLILLDAIKRAVERGISIRIIAEELHPDLVEKLKKIKIEMRLGKAWPYAIVVDSRHGITVDMEDRGVWFLNYNSDYKNRFEEMWSKAEVI